jgi:hypothetical protein
VERLYKNEMLIRVSAEYCCGIPSGLYNRASNGSKFRPFSRFAATLHTCKSK